MTTADNDVTTIVLAQHKDVAARLAAVSSAAGDARGDEFGSLAEMLAGHEAAEETVIYPMLRKTGAEGVRIADARTGEETAATETLTKLKGMDPSSKEFEALFTEFSAKVHAHAASEEAEVIPLVISKTTHQERQTMGDAFVASQHAAAHSS